MFFLTTTPSELFHPFFFFNDTATTEIYTLSLHDALPISVTLWRGMRDRSYWHHFGERFGFGARLEGSGIWVHAVSVGEVQASAALVSTLRERYPEVPAIVTVFTPTGAQRARSLFKNLADGRYIPYGLP